MTGPLDENPNATMQTSSGDPAEPASEKEVSFAELFEAAAARPGDQALQPGDRVQGTVVLINGDTVFIDYGAKSEGWAEATEFQDKTGVVTVKAGDTVELTFIEPGPSGAHLGTCLRRTSGEAGFDLLRTAFESGVSVEGRVTGTNKGGFEVAISGFSAFCPFSQMDTTYCDHPEEFIGSSSKFKVLRLEEDRKTVILSRRAILQEEQRLLGSKTRERLAIGEEFLGRVTRLTSFGAFVDIGGLEGLVHISEISRSQVSDPAQVLTVGQEVRVRVVLLDPGEKGKERIGLSMKALEPDPWDQGLGFSEGDIVTGKVRTLATFGAFLEIIPGVEGLVHISEISAKRITHPKEKLVEGQSVEVKVLEINPAQRRISLSIREVLALSEAGRLEMETIRTGEVIRRRMISSPLPDPSQGETEEVQPDSRPGEPPLPPGIGVPVKPMVGLISKGIIRSVKPYGFFVDLPDLGSHQSGLLHKSQFSAAEPGSPAKGLKEGNEIEVEIIGIDEQGRISLSRRSVLINQDRKVLQDYRTQEKDTAKLGTMADLFNKFNKK